MPRARGTIIEVSGRVLDRHGHPVNGARLELWQCNAAGRYAHAADVSTAPLDLDFQGYAALRTDASGAWRIVTVKPGGYDPPIGHRPPHLHWDLRGAATGPSRKCISRGRSRERRRPALPRARRGGAHSVAVRDAADPQQISLGHRPDGGLSAAGIPRPHRRAVTGRLTKRAEKRKVVSRERCVRLCNNRVSSRSPRCASMTGTSRRAAAQRAERQPIFTIEQVIAQLTRTGTAWNGIGSNPARCRARDHHLRLLRFRGPGLFVGAASSSR